MKHHLFSLEVCVHDKASADFVRKHLTTIRETLEDRDDLHVFRTTETLQQDTSSDDEDSSSTVAASQVHLAS